MYIAVQDLTTRDLQGYEITRYRSGDVISNWKYFWLKRKYKKAFIAEDLYPGTFEEEYRRELQERDNDTLIRDTILFAEMESIKPLVDPIEQWSPHDDHMLILHNEDVLSEPSGITDSTEQVNNVDPTEQWQEDIHPIEETTVEDIPEPEHTVDPEISIQDSTSNPIDDIKSE